MNSFMGIPVRDWRERREMRDWRNEREGREERDKREIGWTHPGTFAS
jgi:hypothetical protein